VSEETCGLGHAPSSMSVFQPKLPRLEEPVAWSEEEAEEEEEMEEMEESIVVDDGEDDPDWVRTPLFVSKTQQRRPKRRKTGLFAQKNVSLYIKKMSI